MRQRHILNVDIHHFFPSCSRDHVLQVFQAMVFLDKDAGRKRRLTDDECSFLTSVSCYHGALTIGSPSSPFIANRVMLPIDGEIEAALPQGYSYSRYSDDITISANSRINVNEIVAELERILGEHGFQLNRKKTHYGGTGGRRRVTGVYITSDGRLSLGRKRKNALKKELYQFLQHNDGRADHVLGRLLFCKQVDPDYFNILLAKYANCGAAKEYGGVMPALRDLL